MEQALVEAVKELGRNAILAVIPVVTLALQDVLAGVPVDWKAITVAAGATAALAILRSVDRYIHESDSGRLKDTNGLIPF